MDLNQLFAQGLQYIQGNRGIIYKSARFTVSANLTAQNSFGFIIQVVLLKKGFQVKIIDGESTFNYTLFLLVKKVTAFRTLP